MKDAAHIKVKVDRIDVPLNVHTVAEFPSVFLSQSVVNDHALAVALPRLDLIFRHLHIAEDLEELFGIGPEAREEVFRLLVFINSAKPGHRNYRHDSRDSANLLAVEAGQSEGKRYLDDEPPVSAPIQRCPSSREKACHNVIMKREQEQREGDAQHRQDAAALVAECVLGHKSG